ncbi:MAG TPA: metalloregulator ArsR/SmtB family transcription factor [Aggregatilinea sp.]|jgi:ArsR family transcriptional regulator|uniref:ArsR/SmtB family transcription factor n=1 Tax=Aggregatilinea sp. TaxID=2806333 RepID=UPI002BEF6914|nr:metalloregulator ArsR/SmtB family transcription factor [Aggregatilinea sp.]HML21402.1 metalloregulator ArsR/SmtB family transcription factor [Aggregatilinea sp.]
MPTTPLTLSDPHPASAARRTSCSSRDTTLHLTADEADRFAALSKTLGHPVRVQIVDLLSRYGGDVCVCDIERHFDLTQPTISHHLKVLREAGLIDAEQRGLWIYYQLRPGTLDGLRDWLDHLK